MLTEMLTFSHLHIVIAQQKSPALKPGLELHEGSKAGVDIDSACSRRIALHRTRISYNLRS
jgi:hypothetical protein